jgi:hypothetical protein
MSGLTVKFKNAFLWLALNINGSLVGWHQKIVQHGVE